MHPSTLLKRDLKPCVEQLRGEGKSDREIYRTLTQRGFAENAVRTCLHYNPTRRRRPRWLPRRQYLYANA